MQKGLNMALAVWPYILQLKDIKIQSVESVVSIHKEIFIISDILSQKEQKLVV